MSMEAKRNKISQRVAKFSDQDIADAYKEIVDWKKTGILVEGSCKLREIDRTIREIIGSESVNYRLAEEAVLLEAGRRFYNLIEAKTRYADLKVGVKVWYVDFETGEIETGTISSVHFKGGKLDSFSVDFDCGDFDEFSGKAMGKDFFLREADAHTALRNGG